jgi:taurine dioxygenase
VTLPGDTVDYEQIAVRANAAVGAEVCELDLTSLSDAVVAELNRARGEYGVLFFRDQVLSEADHVAVAERFGRINVNRFFTAVDGVPQIAEVRKEPEQIANIGGGWHTDHSYDEAPAMGSILYAREVPEVGGDTIFASMYAAYDSLSEGMKSMLCSLNAVHSSRHVFGARAERPADLATRLGNQADATQDAVHPMVIRHPLSGRPALYVNPGFTLRIQGWTAEESAPLLGFLYAHATRPEHTYRFQWAPGSVAFWDNRATWHYALNDYHGERRLMHRITLEGEALAAADPGGD